MFGILNFTKPKRKAFTRYVSIYDQGNYDLLRERVSETDWDSLKDEDINKYDKNVTDHSNKIAKQCIPNTFIKVNPTDPLWITSDIKKTDT